MITESVWFVSCSDFLYPHKIYMQKKWHWCGWNECKWFNICLTYFQVSNPIEKGNQKLLRIEIWQKTIHDGREVGIDERPILDPFARKTQPEFMRYRSLPEKPKICKYNPASIWRLSKLNIKRQEEDVAVSPCICLIMSEACCSCLSPFLEHFSCIQSADT